MQIQWLEVENLGPYLGGPHHLNLRPLRKKGKRQPITLIRGLNGAGKTTLLGAIQLVVHGDRAMGGAISQAGYRQHLRELLPYSNPAERAKVSVSILYQPREGGVEEFVAVRSWWLDGDQLKDSFEVTLDGERLDEDSWYRWQRFTETNFPPHLAPLFIFDAEKTADLITSNNEHGHSSAYAKVFGLDGPRRLLQDLDGLIRKLTKESLTAEDDKRLALLEEQEGERRAERDALLHSLAVLKTERAGKKEELGNLDQELGISHEDFAHKRESLNGEIAKAKEARERISQEMIAVWGGVAPLMLCPNLSAAMLKRVAEDRKTLQSTEFRAELQGLAGLTLQENPSLDTEDVRTFIALLKEGESSDEDRLQVVHNCSASEAQRLQTVFQERLPEEVSRLKELGEEHQQATKEYERALGELERLGSGSIVQGLIQRATELGTGLGKLEGQIQNEEHSLGRLESALEKLQEEIRMMEECQSLALTGDDPLSRATRARVGIRKYLTYLQEEKNEEMSAAVLKSFNALIRKEDLLASVRLDPSSGWFQEIVSKHGYPIMPSKLSEGEKQMLALAYLWALIRCDGREFPVVIDTPFGRLDSIHRRNIVEKFLVKDLSQVVLLVTDEEANENFYDAVGSHVARSYHLNHDPDTGITNIEMDLSAMKQERALT